MPRVHQRKHMLHGGIVHPWRLERVQREKRHAGVIRQYEEADEAPVRPRAVPNSGIVATIGRKNQDA